MYTNVNDNVKSLISTLQKKQAHINKILQKCPDGTLNICTRASGETNYYHRYNDEKGVHLDYIPKKTNLKLAKELATSAYLKNLDAIISKQLALLRKFNDSFSLIELEDAYYDLPVERQRLIAPLFLSSDDYAKAWDAETYEKCSKYPEGLIYTTDKGDLVRSKSELIIANYLHAHRDKLFYRYECPLTLDHPYSITIYPDFTIISRRTGQIVYLEHCGMLDNEQYANAFVNKMNTYISNDIIPGRDVILTSETSTQPLVLQTLWIQVQNILGF